MYYFGEFSHFNSIVLFELVHYLREHPEETIELNTYEDYARILNLFRLPNLKLIRHPLSPIRLIHSSNLDNKEDKNVVDHLNINLNIYQYFEKGEIKAFDNILGHMLSPDMVDYFDSKYKNLNNIVCIFPRNRNKFDEKLDWDNRNMIPDTLNQIDEMVLDTFLYREFNTFVIGKKSELLEGAYKIPVVDDIFEMIYLLKKCALFITPDSGMIDFAVNCGTKNIAVISHSDSIQLYHEKRNIFNSNFYYILTKDNTHIAKFRSEFYRNNNFREYIPPKEIDGKIYPFVTCVVPTYNRRKFLPNLIKFFNYQDYPKEMRELVILDDSPENNGDVVEQYNSDKNIRYYYYNTGKKMNIGKKRNIINQLIRGDFVVCLDDDDYYPPNRISHAIESMMNNNIGLCGSTVIPVYFTSLKKIYRFGPISENHGTNGTVAYHRKFLNDNFYIDSDTHAEENHFFRFFSYKMIQLEEKKVMLCISHNSNTYDKHQILQYGKETELTLEDFIDDPEIIEFYKNL